VRGLDGRVAIVTGAAHGIGRAVAEAFARAGSSVALLDRDETPGEAAAAEIASAPNCRALFVGADVSDGHSVEQALARVADELGPPTILVNNAAVFVLKGLEATREDWRHSFEVNVMGAAIATRCALPYMRAEGGGAVVNMGSISSFVAQKGSFVYNTTKAALVEMTRCLALDLVDDGIRVNCVCPGTVWTPAVAQMAASLGHTRETVGDEPNFGREQIMKRLPDPPEIAGAVLFLASDEASFITGESLMVDGGWKAR
jgi:NAD(P)-dependent dehydrogenase (short-subunit alcohol dehydrogenase family)